MRYLYVFGYQTPPQLARSVDDEDSAAFFIEAPSQAEALAWGREVSEKFVRDLHRNDEVSWKALDYAHWIEDLPSSRFTPADLARLDTVSVGSYPDWSSWR